eukprot:2816422-Amphidinium_carterae.1
MAPGTRCDPEGKHTFCAPADDLTWEKRWPVLKAMALEHDPDIIGLQEHIRYTPGPPNPCAQ